MTVGEGEEGLGVVQYDHHPLANRFFTVGEHTKVRSGLAALKASLTNFLAVLVATLKDLNYFAEPDSAIINSDILLPKGSSFSFRIAS